METDDTRGLGNGCRSQSSKRRKITHGVQAAGVVNLKLGRTDSDNVSFQKGKAWSYRDCGARLGVEVGQTRVAPAPRGRRPWNLPFNWTAARSVNISCFRTELRASIILHGCSVLYTCTEYFVQSGSIASVEGYLYSLVFKLPQLPFLHAHCGVNDRESCLPSASPKSSTDKVVKTSLTTNPFDNSQGHPHDQCRNYSEQTFRRVALSARWIT